MTEPITDRILNRMAPAAELYYRLILVVGVSNAGKTKALQGLQVQISAPLINVNLELSRCLLDLTGRQRNLQVPHLLEDTLLESRSDVVLLDNLELLFDPALKQDPLRLLQGLSRKRTIIAAWNGDVKYDTLFYAEPGHPEYRHYPINDLIIEILHSEK
ncbi:MAG: BREX-3 system P-loop-containing protein BrxF [Caldisericales bacterium]|nr:BREX-3 system P-loop-containing protein BrxF [Caldisericales bacterium]